MRIYCFALAGGIIASGAAVAPAADFGRGFAVEQLYPSGSAVVPCRFPDGWNVGDASQAIRGVPGGIAYRCRVNASGIVVDRDGAPTE